MHHRSKSARPLHLVLALLALSVGALAQVRVAAWPKIEIELVGTDGQGDPLVELSIDALVVKENGRAVKIEEVTPLSKPVSVCILFDSSGSMYDRRDILKAILVKLIQVLPQEDEVCIADFAYATHIDQDLTMDRQAALTSLQYVKAQGGTALYDGLAALAEYMRKTARNESRAIVVLSDCSDNASKISEKELRTKMAASGSPVVHVLRLPGPSHRSMMGHDDTNGARMLAKISGGLVYLPRDAQETEAAVDHLAAAMKNRYILSYESDEALRDGRERHIDVELDKVHQREKAVVRAPEGYFAPSQ